MSIFFFETLFLSILDCFNFSINAISVWTLVLGLETFWVYLWKIQRVLTIVIFGSHAAFWHWFLPLFRFFGFSNGFFSALNVHFGLVCLFCQQKFFNFVRIFPDMFSISSKKNLLGFNLDNGFLYVLHQILCYFYRLVSFIAHSAQNNFKLRLLSKQKWTESV